VDSSESKAASEQPMFPEHARDSITDQSLSPSLSPRGLQRLSLTSETRKWNILFNNLI